ncbi:MAG: hypothetical protein WD225_04015 [Ilumatobacteraceae bacterium]
MIRRAAAVTALALVATLVELVGAPDVARADPAGPTDYESEVVGLDPEVTTIDVDIVGGDSFVRLDVRPGVEVTVQGYQGEPYLWFDADGAVWENRRSPATYQNSERYGVGSLPPEADAAAAPEWRRVADGGSWVWHDHRAHRMDPFPPVNAERGEQVLDAVVPLVVDGVEVDVRVASTWMPAPSPWPVGIGLGVGLLLVAALRSRVAVALAAVSAAALAVGVVQFRSLPTSTDPRWIWWTMPAIALVLSLAVVRKPPTVPLWIHGAVLVAAAQLLVWGVERRHGLSRAILPTDAPFWLDRTVSAAALSAGVAAIAIVAADLLRVRVRPTAPARSDR